MVHRMQLQISGRVQGVCYRWSARTEAARRGLGGWVRNRADGAVELYAEGSEEQLLALKSWCRRGPSGADVSNIDATFSEGEATCRAFVIRD